MQLHWLRILLRDLADVTLVSGDTDDRDDPDGQDDNDDNEDNDDNKGIGDAGSTEDIRIRAGHAPIFADAHQCA